MIKHVYESLKILVIFFNSFLFFLIIYLSIFYNVINGIKYVVVHEAAQWFPDRDRSQYTTGRWCACQSQVWLQSLNRVDIDMEIVFTSLSFLSFRRKDRNPLFFLVSVAGM